MNTYIVRRSDELYHHGVKGQSWGDRNGPPYPLNAQGRAALRAQKKYKKLHNEDGSLNEKGRREQDYRISTNKKATIEKGTKLYRISDKQSSDASSGKMYVSANKESGDHYMQELGSHKIYSQGKAFVHEYIAKNDIILPDKKTMEKIELNLLKDKAVQKELIDSLMKKGYSREQATEQVRPYSAGKNACEKILNTTFMTIYGAGSGFTLGVYGALAAGPGALAVGTGVGAALGAYAGTLTETSEKKRALGTTRISYGDKNNKVINEKLQKALADKGYNGMKDYNDRRAYGKHGEHAVIVFDSKNNAQLSKSTKVQAKNYGESYARDYLKKHPESKLSFDDLVKDGEAKYKDYYERGLINRAREAENKRLLAKAKKKERS